MEAFENSDVSVTCHRFQSKLEHLSKMALVMNTCAVPGPSRLIVFEHLWIGENDTKTLVWMKIFCFVFAAMKTETFENALVSMGPI